MDGKRFWSESAVVVPGETIPQLFWNAQQQRGNQIFLR
jgi:hypothetical protein